MAKKKKLPDEIEVEDVPAGDVDEDGDEILDLYDEEDNLEEDIDYDLSKIEDEMLADETEDEEFGMEVDEVVTMLRKVKCDPCPGLKSIPGCKIAHDYSCPKPNKP
jgi:hypothetical protein